MDDNLEFWVEDLKHQCDNHQQTIYELESTIETLKQELSETEIERDEYQSEKDDFESQLDEAISEKDNVEEKFIKTEYDYGELVKSISDGLNDIITSKIIKPGEILFIRIPSKSITFRNWAEWSMNLRKILPKDSQALIIPHDFELNEDTIKCVPEKFVTNELLLAAKL